MPEVEALHESGSNNTLLHVKVSPEMFDAMRQIADAYNRPVPQMVRALLMFHLYPLVLDVAVKRIKEDADASALESTLSQSAFVSEEMKRVVASCEAAADKVRTILDIAERKQEIIAEAERVAQAAWKEFLESLPDDVIYPEKAAQERHSETKMTAVGKATGAAKAGLKTQRRGKEKQRKAKAESRELTAGKSPS